MNYLANIQILITSQFQMLSVVGKRKAFVFGHFKKKWEVS